MRLSRVHKTICHNNRGFLHIHETENNRQFLGHQKKVNSQEICGTLELDQRTLIFTGVRSR